MGSVRASRIPQLLTRPPEHQAFWPLTTNVGFTSGASRQRRQIAAGVRLGEELAPHVFGRERRSKVAPLLLIAAIAHDRSAGENEADHVEHAGDTGSRTLEQPFAVMLWAQPVAAILGRPVDAGVARLEHLPLPGDAGIDVLRRADRPVITGGVAGVLGQPCRGSFNELLDIRHRREDDTRQRLRATRPSDDSPARRESVSRRGRPTSMTLSSQQTS